MSAFTAHLTELGTGILYTIVLIVIAAVGSLVLGTVICLLRASPIRVARTVATAYVLVFRNIPLPVQMVLFAFGLPLLGVKFSFFNSAAIVLVIYTTPFVSEILRSGLHTVTGGELEASRALGFSPVGTMRNVALPQAFSSLVLPLGNVLITMVKNTSVAAIIGVTELTFAANKVAVEEVAPFALLGGAAVAYVVIGLTLRRLITILDRKVAFAR